MRQLKRRLRHWGPMWRYGLNLSSTLRYCFDGNRGSVLSPEARRIVTELRETGIAVSSDAALFGEHSLLSSLDCEVADLQGQLASEIAALRGSAGAENTGDDKPYMKFYLGLEPELDVGGIFARYAIQRQFVGIADAYFRMRTKMRYCNVWHTFANDGALRGSQLWHRDREDYQILKVFLYLGPVDDGAGPFTYAPRTHMLGDIKREPASRDEAGVARTGDDQMNDVVPRESWVKACGGKGTLIFADTRGYHRGGVARTADRLLYTCMFTSDASARRYFSRIHGANPDPLALARIE